MKNGKYEVGDWVKSSRSMLDITAGKAYRVVQAEEGGFYVVDDMNDRNWSSYCEGNWSLCSSSDPYKVGDWVKVIDNSTASGMEKPLAAGIVAKITERAHLVDGWLLEGSGGCFYRENQLEHAEAPAPARVPKVGDKVRIVRKVEKEDGWSNCWADEMDRLVADGVDYAVSEVNWHGVYLVGAGRFGWPAGSLELVADTVGADTVGSVSLPVWAPKVGDRVRATRESYYMDMTGQIGVVMEVDGGDDTARVQFDDEDLWQEFSALELVDKPATPEPVTPPEPVAAPASGHTEIRLTLSLDMSEFADKLQRVVDAIRAAA